MFEALRITIAASNSLATPFEYLIEVVRVFLSIYSESNSFSSIVKSCKRCCYLFKLKCHFTFCEAHLTTGKIISATRIETEISQTNPIHICRLFFASTKANLERSSSPEKSKIDVITQSINACFPESFSQSNTCLASIMKCPRCINKNIKNGHQF